MKPQFATKCFLALILCAFAQSSSFASGKEEAVQHFTHDLNEIAHETERALPAVAAQPTSEPFDIETLTIARNLPKDTVVAGRVSDLKQEIREKIESQVGKETQFIIADVLAFKPGAFVIRKGFMATSATTEISMNDSTVSWAEGEFTFLTGFYLDALDKITSSVVGKIVELSQKYEKKGLIVKGFSVDLSAHPKLQVDFTVKHLK